MQQAISLLPVIKNLNDIFECFNEQYFESELSRAIITAAPKGRKKATGWCTSHKAWRDIDAGYYEINICAEHINAPIEDVCEVLLHEMCHFYNLQNNIQDCSRSSQYHNSKFKNCAEQHGLNVEKHPSYGYTITSLKPETLEYIKTLNLTDFTLFRDSPTGEEKKKSSTRKYICPTGCDVSIRATKEVNVICGTCKARLVQD